MCSCDGSCAAVPCRRRPPPSVQPARLPVPGPRPTGRLSVVSDSRVSRRTLLLAAATTATAAGLSTGLSGCEAKSVDPDQPAQATMDALTAVLIEEQQLLKLYQQTMAAYPELATVVSDPKSQASAHVDALMQAAPVAAAQAAASSSTEERGGSRPTPTESAPPPAPPVDAASARLTLAQAVDAMAGSLRAAALRAEGDLAALLGSCAASTACHARLLAS